MTEINLQCCNSATFLKSTLAYKYQLWTWLVADTCQYHFLGWKLLSRIPGNDKSRGHTNTYVSKITAAWLFYWWSHCGRFSSSSAGSWLWPLSNPILVIVNNINTHTHTLMSTSHQTTVRIFSAHTYHFALNVNTDLKGDLSVVNKWCVDGKGRAYRWGLSITKTERV